jgi:hypothetical protein
VNSGKQWLGKSAPPQSHWEGGKRLATPNVGAVRVTLVSGDVFEGRLEAVGKGKVELLTKIGSITLGASRVETIARLDPTQLDKDGTESREGEQTGSPRIRVTAPGGVFTGRQVSRKGDTVTLITDEGLRITLTSDQIEEVGSRKAVGLKRRDRGPKPAPEAKPDAKPEGGSTPSGSEPGAER